MPVYKFSPHLATSEERSETFVGREAILEDLLGRVSKIDADARHCILIGPRGIGKTHLLLLLADRIEDDEDLASRWAVVRFAEEEYSITSLAELLLKIIESLPDGNGKDIGRDADLALAHILDFSAKSGKKILLLMDNIHLYFNQFPDADIGRMREILISKPIFLIIGGAPSYFKQMTGYEEAFYNFFEPIHLRELQTGQVEKMLRRRLEFEGKQDFLEEFDQCQPKIRAVAHLTGGNPRLILMLYQVMCESGIVEAAEAFKQLLDELTPYFQGRMDGLPPQQRKVLDTLASQESPATPTELAELAGMQVNAVTSQLTRLKDVGYVQQVRRRKSRGARYEVTERLFRMWRGMRIEAGRGRLAFLIRFLTLWYTPAQLVDETGKLLTQLGEAEGRDRPRLLLQMQYLKEAMPEMLRSEMETLYSYAESGRPELAAAGITPLKDLAIWEGEVKEHPNEANAWYNRGLVLGNRDRYEEALESFDRAVQIQPDLSLSWLARGLMLGKLGRHAESLESCDKVVQTQPDLSLGWLARGMSLDKLGKYAEALESFNKALQIKPDHAPAWLGRGSALGKLGRHDEALESCDKAVQIEPEDGKAWGNRGVVLFNLGRYDEALESLRKAGQFAEAQDLEEISRSASLIATLISLLVSLESLRDDNLGPARRALKQAIEDGKGIKNEKFQQALFICIKGVLGSGKTEFAREAIGTIVSELGEDYNRLLRPFSVAIEYMETRDESILERLQQEERELVLEIAEQADAQQAQNKINHEDTEE